GGPLCRRATEVRMATIPVDGRLGPFAPDQRAPGGLARAAFALGVGAIVLAVVRPVIENIQPRSDLSAMRLPGIVVGIAAIVVSLAAFFRVSTQGLRGRGLSLAGVWLGAAAALTVVVYAATVDGNLRLGQFAHYYLN